MRINLANFTPNNKLLLPGTIVANLSSVNVIEIDDDFEFCLCTVVDRPDSITDNDDSSFCS